ncbi:TPA: HNH endonuclease [Bacillus wiedmannii]|uniref:HNH endonuclease n=1 Tax=Bacillus wiedmannii TaxID=1890302 RepID=UPI000BF37FF1|nr:HNH endonuclease [Bacillus wiedmannii]PEP54031.1 hypothetical protein CN557_08160 [Bacillus wiedmannii]HDX9652519.1 HNH endonuclease [Bacillus wiedmannii]
MSIQCIFCLNDFDKGSEEHVFPDSLGGKVVIYDVCKRCNDKLGSEVDSYLVNNPFMEFARFTKKLSGKNGHIPNPIDEGRLKDNNEKVYYKFSKEGNPESLYMVPVVTKSEDGETITVKVDASEPDKAVEIINKILKRRGGKVKSKEEILSQGVFKKVENPWLEMNMEFDINSYRKAILKIIYEMTYLWLGKEYLKDPIANILRTYIFSKDLEVEGLIGSVDLVDKKNITGLAIFADGESHTAILIRDNNKLCCYVNLFNIFEGTLVVSEQPEQYLLESGIENGKMLKSIINSNEVVEKNLQEAILEISQK